jgi:hypothetical protein
VSERVRREVWREEVAGVQAAVSRAAEIQAQALPGSQDARQATATALRAYRALVQQLQRTPDLHAQTPVDLVREAVAEGITRAERIEARSREAVRQDRGKDQGMGW